MAKAMQYKFHQWSQLPAKPQLSVEIVQHPWVELKDVGYLILTLKRKVIVSPTLPMRNLP